MPACYYGINKATCSYQSLEAGEYCAFPFRFGLEQNTHIIHDNSVTPEGLYNAVKMSEWVIFIAEAALNWSTKSAAPYRAICSTAGSWRNSSIKKNNIYKSFWELLLFVDRKIIEAEICPNLNQVEWLQGFASGCEKWLFLSFFFFLVSDLKASVLPILV